MSACRIPHLLINNAGLIAAGTRTITGDGHELTFQVNHLPPFLLTHPAPRAVDALAGTCDHGRQVGKQAGRRQWSLTISKRSGRAERWAPTPGEFSGEQHVLQLAGRGPAGVAAAAVHPGMIRVPANIEECEASHRLGSGPERVGKCGRARSGALPCAGLPAVTVSGAVSPKLSQLARALNAARSLARRAFASGVAGHSAPLPCAG